MFEAFYFEHIAYPILWYTPFTEGWIACPLIQCKKHCIRGVDTPVMAIPAPIVRSAKNAQLLCAEGCKASVRLQLRSLRDRANVEVDLHDEALQDVSGGAADALAHGHRPSAHAVCVVVVQVVYHYAQPVAVACGVAFCLRGTLEASHWMPFYRLLDEDH